MDWQTMLEYAKEFLWGVWSFDGVKVIVAHVAINLVVAVAAAMKAGTFELGKIGEFLWKKLAPYVMVYFAVKVAGLAAGLDALAAVAWAAIEATLLGDLMDNLVKLGLTMPEPIARLVVKNRIVVEAPR